MLYSDFKMDTRHIIVHFMAPRWSTDVMQPEFKGHEILKTLNELVYVKVAYHCTILLVVNVYGQQITLEKQTS